MKRLLLLFAIAMLASCSNKSKEIDGAISTLSFDGEVSFSASILPESKVASDVFESGDQIVVTAFDGESTFASQAAYSYSGTTFESASPIALMSEEQELSYIAAYPAVSDFANEFEFTVIGDQSAGDNFEMSDLLLASAEATNSLSPKLTFNHALSSLIINFEGDDLAGGTLTIYAKATTAVDMAADSYTASGDAIALTPATYGSTSYQVIFAPQTIVSDNTIATYELNGETYTWSASRDLDFDSGYCYLYTWTIDTSIEDPSYDGDVSYDGNINEWEYIELNDDDADVVPATLYLADLSATSYPEEDTWIILDETAITEDFAGFSAAIEQISTNDTERRILVEFPNIEAIPDYAIFGESSSSSSFASGALYSVSAEKATSIGEYAFQYCSTLTTVDMPLVTTLGSSAFLGCTALTTIDMPLVTTLGSSAFLGCTALTTVDMPLVTTIGHWVLSNCTVLTTVDMPLVSSIGNFAFNSCTALKTINIDNEYYTFKNGILYDDTQMSSALFVCDYLIVDGDLSLPETILSISSYAFTNNTSLIKINAPSVTTIESSAFYGCTALTTVDMPLVTTIGNQAFRYCEALTTLKLATGDGVVLNSFGFSAADFQIYINIDLTVGAANASLVSGNVLTVDYVSFEFKSITFDNIDQTIFSHYLYNLTQNSVICHVDAFTDSSIVAGDISEKGVVYTTDKDADMSEWTTQVVEYIPGYSGSTPSYGEANAYDCVVADLDPSTTYYLMPYVTQTNSAGTSYGSTITFTTYASSTVVPKLGGVTWSWTTTPTDEALKTTMEENINAAVDYYNIYTSNKFSFNVSFDSSTSSYISTLGAVCLTATDHSVGRIMNLMMSLAGVGGSTWSSMYSGSSYAKTRANEFYKLITNQSSTSTAKLSVNSTGIYYYDLVTDGTGNATLSPADATTASLVKFAQIMGHIYDDGLSGYSIPDGYYDLLSGVNVALNKTATASVEASGYSASNVVDGDKFSLDSRWMSSSSTPAWIQIDLEEEYTISGFNFYGGTNSVTSPYYYDTGVQDYKFQYYNSNTNSWIDLVDVTGQSTYLGCFSKSFDPVTCSVVRLYITTNNHEYQMRVFEIEVISDYLR